MHRNFKTQKKINIIAKKHHLIYGSNANGLNCIPIRNVMRQLISESKYPVLTVNIDAFSKVTDLLDKTKFKRIKTNEGVIRTFSYPKYTKMFLSKLEKRFFKKFKKPIFSKIENNGKKITYKIGEKI